MQLIRRYGARICRRHILVLELIQVREGFVTPLGKECRADEGRARGTRQVRPMALCALVVEKLMPLSRLGQREPSLGGRGGPGRTCEQGESCRDGKGIWMSCKVIRRHVSAPYATARLAGCARHLDGRP